MKNNEGYIKVISVMQKFFDQAISGNWSYNPENYADNEVPVSVMANDLKSDEMDLKESLNKLLEDASEEDCESCKI